MSVSCVCRVHCHSQLSHMHSSYNRGQTYFGVVSDVILKEPVALSKFGSSCYRQILDFKECQYFTLD